MISVNKEDGKLVHCSDQFVRDADAGERSCLVTDDLAIPSPWPEPKTPIPSSSSRRASWLSSAKKTSKHKAD